MIEANAVPDPVLAPDWLPSALAGSWDSWPPIRPRWP